MKREQTPHKLSACPKNHVKRVNIRYWVRLLRRMESGVGNFDLMKHRLTSGMAIGADAFADAPAADSDDERSSGMTPDQFALRTMQNQWTSSDQMGQFIETCYPEIRAYQSSSDPNYRLTLVSMYTVHWVLNDRYNEFVQEQPPKQRLKRTSWDFLMNWIADTQPLPTETQIDALFTLLAMRQLPRFRPWRQRMGVGSADPDHALLEIMKRNPAALPSFQRLEDDMQRLLVACVSIACNVGQFINGEIVVWNLEQLKNFIEDFGLHAFGFYLFQWFCGVAAVKGARSTAGSVFITEPIFKNVRRGLMTLDTLLTNTVHDVYLNYMQARALELGEEILDEDSLALVRLFCICRCDENSLDVVKTGFFELAEHDRSSLLQYGECKIFKFLQSHGKI